MIIFIIGGVLMLGISIFVHELGHYVFGRMVGINAEIFSIGYGRGIWQKKIGETTYQITAIPLGGYVKFYGDDYSSQEKIPGGFFSAPPLKRMIPVIGGPLFNLLLGFILYLLVHTIYGPLSPRIQIWEESETESPAYKSGLRDGDMVLSINDTEVTDFYDIKQNVAMSEGRELRFGVQRNSEILTIPVRPQVDSSGIAFIGIRPPGKRYLEVGYPSDELWSYRFSTIFGQREIPASLRALPYLNDGDVILSVAGEIPHSITDLQRILGRHHGETVEVAVKRQTLSWIGPWFTEEVSVRIPSRGEYVVSISGIVDVKYNEKIPDQKLYSSMIQHQRGLSSIHIDGEPAGSFEHLFEHVADDSTVTLKIDSNEYQAKLKVEKIGMLGFRARDVFEKEYLPAHQSAVDVLLSSLTDTWDTIKVYPDFFGKLFSGRMSFVDTARGPVAMFAMAGVIFKTGLQEYLQLMAAISIALMVMNLLPFPVVDGGHLVLFMYEAVAGKPLSPVIVETIYRFGFTVLLLLGLWIMYKDILFFIGM